jgi:hypothetical protein
MTPQFQVQPPQLEAGKGADKRAAFAPPIVMWRKP